MAIATFALGCFWSPEQRFRAVEGVTDVTVGYTGGHVEDPDYKTVCSGRTGHAEAVRVEYDPDVVSYDDLLTVFWEGHNPTTRDRQGLDRGSQYRSTIFTHDDGQAARATATRDERQAALQDSRKLPWGRTVVTEIEPAPAFWPAEDYHQQYLARRRGAAVR